MFRVSFSKARYPLTLKYSLLFFSFIYLFSVLYQRTEHGLITVSWLLNLCFETLINLTQINSVSLACYRQIGSKSTNHSPLAWRTEGQKVTLVVDLPQVDLMNFRIELVRPPSGRFWGSERRSRERLSFVRRVLNKPDEGLFRKSTLVAVIGGFRSKIEGNLETFPWVFCFPKSRIDKNGGKYIHVHSIWSVWCSVEITQGSPCSLYDCN